eukprot:GILJ01022243.1.p1 GENE.GILJ01022243.1~~GILJ01022243.1.p1  ORF type:complete len:285 (+),score=32.09 GILJ01022243.1:31-855(+)
MAETHRNKGVICKNYFESHRATGSTTEGNPPPPCFMGSVCPYAHVADGDVLPLPESVCNFFMRGKCLRDNCGYFHGKRQLLAEIKAKLEADNNRVNGENALYYRPQDYLGQQVVSDEFRIENIIAVLRQQDQQQPATTPFSLPPPPQMSPMLVTSQPTSLFRPPQPAPYPAAPYMTMMPFAMMPPYYGSPYMPQQPPQVPQQFLPQYLMQQPTMPHAQFIPQQIPASLIPPPAMPGMYPPGQATFPAAQAQDPMLYYFIDPRTGAPTQSTHHPK